MIVIFIRLTIIMIIFHIIIIIIIFNMIITLIIVMVYDNDKNDTQYWP